MCLNSTTGKSPSELLYGFRPRLKYDIELTNILADSDRLKTFDKNRNKALGKINKTAKATKKRYDKNRLAAITFKKMDMVLVKKSPIIKGLKSGKLVQKYMGPVRVTAALPNDRHDVQSLSKGRRRLRGVVASDRLKLFKSSL
ncbi:hypothetical protein NQ314_018002 [Rhamnusium bicolor]|uniref:Uncharacterized protein n=1 Tax=Rhamnusium bicolor TaxID=1586634 RepID=A0AAV8WSU6_9CUCU|nr:hypothetical protein NQ314_018002 [Rhamnusium bicolor]